MRVDSGDEVPAPAPNRSAGRVALHALYCICIIVHTEEVVRPDEDVFFLQVRVLSGQALEHPVADPGGRRDPTGRSGVTKVRYRRRANKRAATEVNAVATS